MIMRFDFCFSTMSCNTSNIIFSLQMIQAKHNRPNTNSLAVPVDSAKEPAGRQKSSGLAHLMSALHQNAAAVVNSKTQLNGPDQVREFHSIPKM